MDDIPHIDWPIQVTGVAYQTCQQDTDQEAAANIAVLCSFERGTRIEQPDFGIADPTFALMPVDTADIERQAAVYEPRAQLAIAVRSDPAGAATVSIRVHIATPGEG